jgi:hypothetical protein
VVTKAGTASLAIIFAAGLWLLAAPFALRYQPVGAGWTGATRADVITGGTLAVAGFAGIIGVIAGRVRELYADARSAASAACVASASSVVDRGNPRLDARSRCRPPASELSGPE